jgi:hypothetical protein
VNRETFAIVLSGVLLAGCASYTPSSAPIPEPTPAEWTVQNALAVAVDPYADAERQKATFDADLNKADVIAIQVVVENRQPRAMLVRPSDMALELPTGKKFSPSGVTTVVNKVGESGSVVGAAFAFGIIGAIAASDSEESARTARTADYKEKAFIETILRRQESAHGFVFFIPPRGTEPFDAATLRLRFIDFESAVSEVIEVPLSGLNYEETAEDSDDAR